MFKHIKILAISMILIVGSIVAVYSIPRDSINQWSAGTDALGLTLDSDGVLSGQVDNANDLGSSTYEFKDLYIDGTANIDTLAVDAATAGSLAVTGDSTLTGDATATGDIRTSGILGIGTAESIVVTTHTTITPSSSYVILRSTNSENIMTFSAKPFITATNFSEGDFLIITTTGSVPFVLTEGNAYNLQLGGTTRTIDELDTLTLIYHSTGTAAGAQFFQEISFVNN